jgi:hypothetical protein
MTLVEIILLFLAGVVTGMVNTIAGSGTIFSLGIMVFLGIPIEIANTTNRYSAAARHQSLFPAYVERIQLFETAYCPDLHCTDYRVLCRSRDDQVGGGPFFGSRADRWGLRGGKDI